MAADYSLSATAVRSGSVLGDVGVAQVAVYLSGLQPQRGLWVRRT